MKVFHKLKISIIIFSIAPKSSGATVVWKVIFNYIHDGNYEQTRNLKVSKHVFLYLPRTAITVNSAPLYERVTFLRNIFFEI